MSRRAKIIIASVVVFVVVLLLFFLLFFRREAPAPIVNNTNNVSANAPKLPGGFVPPAGVIMNLSISQNTAPEVNTEDNLKKLAVDFAERFGSFSNQGQYENIKDLKPMMTAGMAKFADSYILELQAKYPNFDKYYGITTKAINAAVTSLDKTKGLGNVTVNIQRREASGTTTSNVKVFPIQEIKLKFLRQGEIWLVDGIYGF